MGLSVAGARFLVVLSATISMGCRREEPLSLEALPTLNLELELTIDGFSPDLGLVRWFGQAPGGTIAVSQMDDHLTRLLDASGNAVGSVGGAGGGGVGGPAEPPIQGGAGWIWDTLWVNDVTLGRIVLYSPDRDLSRTLPPLPGARPRAGEEYLYPGFLSVWPVALLPGDTLLVLAEQAVGGPTQGPFREGRHLLRISADGEILGQVIQVPERAGPGGGVWNSGRSSPVAARSGLPTFHVAPAGDRIALLGTDRGEPEDGTLRLRVVDSHGGSLLDRSYRIQGSASPEGIVLGADRRIWIGFRERPGERSWVALSSEGDPVGRVKVPEGARLHAADDAHLWVTEPNALGVPTVLRFRLVASG